MSMNAFQAALSTGANQFARTPDVLFDIIGHLFYDGQEMYDPCPPDPNFDGIYTAWQDRNYVNPPFKELPRWIDKAVYEKKPTALLMPFRSAARYLHRNLLPHASVVVLWLNRIAFPPYTRPLPMPVMTVGLYCGPDLFAAEEVQVHKAYLRWWDLNHTSDYMPAFRQYLFSTYGYSLEGELHDERPLVPGGLSFACLMTRGQDTLLEISFFLRTNPASHVLALVPDIIFNTVYFAKHTAPYISQVVLTSPHLHLDTTKERARSMTGSVLVVLSGAEAQHFSSDKCLPVYLANWRNYTIIR